MAYNPPIGSIYHLYTTYILPSGGLYATSHLLGEPETTIDYMGIMMNHDKDPYKTTSRMESKSVVFVLSWLKWRCRIFFSM